MGDWHEWRAIPTSHHLCFDEKQGEKGQRLASRMAHYRDMRDLLLFSYHHNILDDVEFILLYHLNSARNRSREQYEPFDLGEQTDDSWVFDSAWHWRRLITKGSRVPLWWRCASWSPCIHTLAPLLHHSHQTMHKLQLIENILESNTEIVTSREISPTSHSNTRRYAS